MTQLTAQLVPELRSDIAPSALGLPTPPALHTLRTVAPQARGVTATMRRLNVEPLIHLLFATAAAALVWTAGVRLSPAVALTVVATWPALLAVFGCYTHRPLNEPVADRLRGVLRAGSALGLASWVATTVIGDAAAPDVLVPTVAAVVAATLLATLASSLARPPTTRLVVAGALADVTVAIDELARSPRRCEVSATCLTGSPAGPVDELPGSEVEQHLGLDGAADVAARHGADALLVLPGPGLSPAVIRRLQWDAARFRVRVYVGTSLLDVAPRRTSTVRAGGLGALHVRPAARGPRHLCKELVERATAAVALTLFLPLLLAVGVAIRRDSPGPAIFRQERVGKSGRTFTMYKFRTMSTEAEQRLQELAERNDADGVLFKMRRDPRVTRLGAVLRRYSIDEIPQLWNVVIGHMSLVGPRPALPCEASRYDVDPRRRLDVKPGLTGLWQVSGRSNLTWQESVRLDIQYVDNWSLALDLSILCRTIRAVLSHQGAY